MSEGKTINGTITDNKKIINIGIAGDITVENKSLIKDLIYKLKVKFTKENTEIYIHSINSTIGADKFIKRYTLDFNLNYVEHNPKYTTHTLYSYYNSDWYGYPYHFSRIYMHLSRFISSCDFFIFISSKSNQSKGFLTMLKYILPKLNKQDKKYTIIQDII